jgi:hypothetical protein
MSDRVVHFEIGLRDVKNIDFYRKVFGWPIPMDNEWNYGMVEPDGNGSIGGGIFHMKEGAGYVTVYVAVDDVAASLAKANAQGGKTVDGPRDLPGIGTIAMFTDPEGNIIGLYKPMAHG